MSSQSANQPVGPSSAQAAMMEPAYKDLILEPESAGEQPRLIGLKCSRCGHYSIGQQQVCPSCWSTDLERTPLSRRAKLYSFSVTELPPFGFQAPLVLGLVDLPEKLRIWSQLQVDDPDLLEIGQELELIIGPLRVDAQGRSILGYQFRPVAGQGD